MSDAHCPLGKWQQQWTVVICNPSRANIRAAYNLSEVVVIGEVPAWYIGKSIKAPHRYHNQYSDELRWIQKTIDDSSITENFLWVGGHLPMLPFQELRVPRYTNSPINPTNEILLLERGLPTVNYETQWPYVLNKGRMQEVLDSYRQPFHGPTIYYNTYSTPNTLDTLPPREVLPYSPLEI